MSEVWALGTHARGSPRLERAEGTPERESPKTPGAGHTEKHQSRRRTAPSVPLSLALAPRAVDRGRADVVEILSPRSGFFADTHLLRSRLP